jgi:hypothetical protein
MQLAYNICQKKTDNFLIGVQENEHDDVGSLHVEQFQSTCKELPLDTESECARQNTSEREIREFAARKGFITIDFRMELAHCGR